MKKLVQFLQAKIVTPMLGFLKQGVTPKKLALTVALGFIFAIFPVIGSTTILCGAVALTLRLNMPAIQLVNYLVYPLQLILLIPFIRAGEFIFSAKPMPLSISQIFSMFKDDLLGAIGTLWWSTLYAITAWLLICPLVAVIIFYLLYPVFKKLKSRNSLGEANRNK